MESLEQLHCIPFLVMTGHINVILVLQSCSDPLQVLPGLSSEKFPASSYGTCDVSSTAVQQEVIVLEGRFIAVNEEVPTGIKQEEIPVDVSFPDIKTEPHEVSCVCVCVCVLSNTFYHCPEMSVVFVMPVFLASWYSNMFGKENLFFSPCRKKCIFPGWFLKTSQIYLLMQ